MGCHEMWVCPAFWPRCRQKVKQYIEQKQQTPKGAGAKRPPPWGAAEGGAIAVFFNVLLDFLSKMWPKCRAHPHFMAPHVGHTSICYNFLLDVITFPTRLYNVQNF